MNRKATPAIALFALFLAGPALSQEAGVYDRIDLSANASVDVEQDLLIAILFAEVENNDQSDAAAAVNADISWAANRARDVDSIEVQTLNYTTRPLYANGRRITGWVARQSLRLESQDAEALSELLGELQQRVAIQSISYQVSPAAHEAAEEALIADAIRKFNQRASLVAEQFGRDGFRVVRLNISSSPPTGLFGGGLQMARAQTAEMAPPSIEAGAETVSVSVNGQVELNP